MSGEDLTADIEWREEQRRYEEALGGKIEAFDSNVLREPVTLLDIKLPNRVGPDDTVAAAARAVREGPHGCVLVLEGDKLIGIVTETDLVERVLAEGRDPQATSVRDVMTADPVVLTRDDTIGFALHKMAVGGYRRLPVVDRGRTPIGVIRQREVVRFLAHFFPEDVLNQPPKSFSQRPPRHRHGG